MAKVLCAIASLLVTAAGLVAAPTAQAAPCLGRNRSKKKCQRQRGDRDALEYAQRTGLQSAMELQEVGIAQHQRAGQGRNAIEEAAAAAQCLQQLQSWACDCSARSTSSRLTWRTSLPCAMKITYSQMFFA